MTIITSDPQDLVAALGDKVSAVPVREVRQGTVDIPAMNHLAIFRRRR